MNISSLFKTVTVPSARRPRVIRETASFETNPWRLRWTTIMSRAKSVAYFAGLVIVASLGAFAYATLLSFVRQLLT